MKIGDLDELYLINLNYVFFVDVVYRGIGFLVRN